MAGVGGAGAFGSRMPRPATDPPYNDRVLAPGSLAPEFTLPDQDDTDVSLAQARGHWVVLWWYPKASTPG
jgi:cytochrome oxidase Cu insertion factor (SCO1/SenC/PrrC family)